MKYKRVSPNVAAEIKILYQIYKIRGKKLSGCFPGMANANIYKHSKNYWDGLYGCK